MAANSNLVNWFEIPTTDLDRAKKFYESVFGIKMDTMDMGYVTLAFFPMDQNAPGAGGALVKGENYTPSKTGTMVYFHVEDIEGTLSKIGASGGKTLLPKMAIGEYGFIAHFEDTDGNRVALHSMK